LDNYGAPVTWNSESKNTVSAIQEEAHAVYSTLLEWTHKHPTWIIGGDLNETRSDLDRVRIREFKARPYKFINTFLEESGGVDVWRHLFPSLLDSHTVGKRQVRDKRKNKKRKRKGTANPSRVLTIF
jgi:hypothetical protein